MMNFLAVRPDPLQLALPNGYLADKQIDQPILRYCWFVRMDAGNKVWCCKLCKKEFTGSNVLVATHFWPKMSSHIPVPYLECLRDRVNMLIEENDEDVLEEDERRAEALDEAVVGDEEDEVGDAKYE